MQLAKSIKLQILLYATQVSSKICFLVIKYLVLLYHDKVQHRCLFQIQDMKVIVVRLVALLLVCLSCFASRGLFFDEKNSFKFEFGIVRNFHAHEHKFPIMNNDVTDLCDYKCPILNFSIAMYSKSRGYCPIFQYRVLNASTDMTYETASNFRGDIFTRINGMGTSYFVRTMPCSGVLTNFFYKSCLHIFDCTFFSCYFHLDAFTIFVEDNLYAGYTRHTCTVDVESKYSAEIFFEKSNDYFGNDGRWYCDEWYYYVDGFSLVGDDKEIFTGISLNIGATLTIEPFEAISVCKLCPYISYMSSNCYMVGLKDGTRSKCFHDDDSIPLCHGVIFELSNGIFWNFKLGGCDSRIGLSHNILFLSIGDRGILVFDDPKGDHINEWLVRDKWPFARLRHDSINKFLDRLVTRYVRQWFASHYMLYSGYTVSIGLQL